MGEEKQQTSFTEDDLNLIHEVSVSIHSIQDLDEMLRSVLHKIKDVFHIEGVSIALHDPERGEFYFIQTVEEEKDQDLERMKRMRFSNHVGIAGWVFHENQPVIVPNTTQDERFFKGIDLQENFDTRSMICLPLSTRKGPLGVLYALNKLDGEFSIKDLRLLEILSGPIAMAIENAQLYGELKQYASYLEEENIRLKSEMQARFNLQGVIGSSPAMRNVFALVEKIINTDTAVLIQGDTGTGKELIARVIHYNGPRKDKPFVIENCGALSENLLESELFGHVKGAFTGAITDRKGLFELADAGTVFLDEIAEMSVAMQVKLLRVLQDGQMRSVGSSKYQKVNVRLITATNKDLAEEVQKGNFREDLFYRIHVFPITLPLLRERRGDIALLAAHFLKKFSAKLERPTARFTTRSLDLLSRYDWPGNVRELENEIERALTLAGSEGEIDEEHLSGKIRNQKEEELLSPNLFEGNLHDATEILERRMILEALRETKNNRSQASRKLGLTRQGLLNKITRLGIKL